jgi:hypothetical protein
MREKSVQMPDRVAVFKTGWCEYYDGDTPKGDHKSLRTLGEGHERYNFKPGPDGRYYGYTPPIAEKYSPAPKDKDGWLIFVLAKKPGETGLYLVGWYEDATFTGSYTPRPEYRTKPPSLERDMEGNPFLYVASAPRATLVDPGARRFRIDGNRMRRAPVYYLRGNRANGPWREKLARALLRAKASVQASGDVKRTAVTLRGGICADPVRRKEVENAAIAAVRARFAKSYDCVDRQPDRCGFDLFFVHRRTERELHVEVKGTAGAQPHFFISRNEYAYAASSTEWRLAMVTNALDEPVVEVMTYDQAKRRFDWEPYSWHATRRIGKR